MIIPLDPQWRIELSSGNVTLAQQRIVGESDKGPTKAKPENVGTETWAAVGYYRTIAQAIRAWLSKAAAEDQAAGLLDLCQQTHRRIAEVSERFGPVLEAVAAGDMAAAQAALGLVAEEPAAKPKRAKRAKAAPPSFAEVAGLDTPFGFTPEV